MGTETSAFAIFTALLCFAPLALINLYFLFHHQVIAKELEKTKQTELNQLS